MGPDMVGRWSTRSHGWPAGGVTCATAFAHAEGDGGAADGGACHVGGLGGGLSG